VGQLGAGTQHLHYHGEPQGREVEEEEEKGPARRTDREMLEQVLSGMHAIQQEHAETRRELTEQRRETLELRKQLVELATYRTVSVASNAADTLPTPIPSRQYPSTAARNGTHNRPSFGVPTLPYYSTPTSASREDVLDEEGERAASSKEKDAEMQRTNKILSTVKGQVQPFYADSTKDKGATVLDFVEKVETTMNDQLGFYPEYRLMIVRSLLMEGAMRWMNNKIKALTNEAATNKRDLEKKPVTWDEVRRSFITDHMGTNSAELWLSKLSLLELGSTKTPTPIELDNQFDTIARHVYPTDGASDGKGDLLLAEKYSKIVHAYSPAMFNSIVRTNRPRTLAEWKTRLTEQFLAEEEIKAMQRAAGTYQYGRGGRGRGAAQGRGGGNTRGGLSQPVSAAAMATVTGKEDGEEGEQYTGEGEPNQQLSAVDSSQRGGRGGRGGRGRGGGSSQRKPVEWTEEQDRLYKLGLCFNCHSPDHLANKCPNPAASSSPQSKGKAGQ
jgi:hypothetical protein